jgi:signal transduction histidine kinase
MLKKFHSIKSRLLVGFSFLTLIIIVLSGIAFYQFQKIYKVRDLDAAIHQLQTYSLYLIQADDKFIAYDAINPRFFQSFDSDILQERQKLQEKIQITWQTVHELSNELHYEYGYDLKLIDSTLVLYNNTAHKLQSFLHQRGHKDYGMIGEMRIYAHQLETSFSLNIKELLMLRRHEKDFLLRNEYQYVEKFNELAEKLLTQQLKKKDERLLIQYTQQFNAIANLEESLGLNDNTGLKKQKDQLADLLLHEIGIVKNKTFEKSKATLQSGNLIFYFTIVVSLILCLVLSYSVSLRISKPMSELSFYINNFMIRKPSSEPLPVKKERFKNADDEVSQLAYNFFDLTERLQHQFKETKEKSLLLERQNKELKEVNTQLDRFVYSAAHDLRAPLTSMLGLVNITEKEIQNKSLHQNFSMMRDSVMKLESFVRDMVDFSKNKRSDIEIRPINLVSFFSEIYGNLKYYGDQPIDFDIRINGNEIFHSDYKRMEIIFRNILSNAVKYQDSLKSQHYIRIDIQQHEDFFTFNISDNGIGIQPEYLHKVFHMFYRATEKSKGSGLGLYLVKETVNLLQGTIAIESIYGESTTFKVVLKNEMDKSKRHVNKQLQIEAV